MKLTEKEKEIILAFADSGMKCLEASRRIYVSRDTVSYHLKKVKEKACLNPLNFYDLVELVRYINGGWNGHKV